MAMDDSSRERSLAAAEKGAQSPPQWKPGRAEWLVFFCMAILSLIVALDTTAVAPVLPVSHHLIHHSPLLTPTDSSEIA